MKYYAFAVCCLLCSSADAKDFRIAARSGEPTRIGVYQSWKKDCSPDKGVVKLVVKPERGKLITTYVDSMIGLSRFSKTTNPCAGKDTPGFRIDYTSNPEFHGSDAFTVQVKWGASLIDVDSYKIDVLEVLKP